MKYSDWFESICSVDKYGFEVRPVRYWLPESPVDEIKRLEMNILCYYEYIKNGVRFPEHVNQARRDDHARLRFLTELAA